MAGMKVSARPPSHTWERFPPAPGLPHGLWFWCRPPHAPAAILVRVPPETYRDPAAAKSLVMRRVIDALGLAPSEVFAWSIGGVAYDGRQGTNPLLDAPLPSPAPGVDPTIAVTLAHVPPPAQMHVVAFAPPQPPLPAAPAENLRARIDNIAEDWHTCLLIEQQLEMARNQVHDTVSRLNALNRDLNS
jgi:hypothetical protein